MKRIIATTFVSLVLVSQAGMAVAQTKAAAKPATTAVSAPPNPADATFTAWDTDHNGSLSQQEFRDGWLQARQVMQLQARLSKQFALIDANKSGAIEASEYGNLVLIKEAGNSAPPLATFDANKDGKLQPAEYVKLVSTLAPQEAAKGKK